MTDNLVTVRVWGDYACFTRPEMKVERVSYPVMTPSAARGILEAIFWEPQIYYLIDAIRIVKRGKWFSFRRNEVNKVISLTNVKAWMQSPEDLKPIQADDPGQEEAPKREATRAQRNMLALEDVEYLITTEVRLTEIGNKNNGLMKYLEEIKRRAGSGKCYHRPALGVREFAADFELEEDAQTALERRAVELKQDWQGYQEELGLMLYDVFNANERAQGFRWLREDEIEALRLEREAPGKKLTAAERKAPLPRYEGNRIQPEAAFFHAIVKESKLDCHPDRARFAKQPRLSE